MHPYQRIEHLDGTDDGLGRTEEGVCAGRQRAYPREPHDDGRNARRGGQEPCGDVPPLFLHVAAGRQIHPLHDGEGDVPCGRDGTGAVQHAQGKGILLQHLRCEFGVLHLLRQRGLQQGEDGVHLLRTAAHRATEQHPDA